MNPAAAATVAPVAPSTVGGVARATLSVGSSVAASATFQVKASAGQPEQYRHGHGHLLRAAHAQGPAGAGACVLQRHRHVFPLEHAHRRSNQLPECPNHRHCQSPQRGDSLASTEVDADALKAITAFKAVTSGTASNKVVGYVADSIG